MTTYVALLRGVNVGGKNKVAMADLKKHLEALGFSDVITHGASGNVILESDKSAAKVKTDMEKALLENFKLDDDLIKVLVLTRKQFETVVEDKPKGFGDEPNTYYSDAIFLIDVDAVEAMTAFSPREGVDQVWKGHGVIYSQRLGAQRTKSRLNKIMETPFYKSMTIRSWSTTQKLLKLLEKMDAPKKS